MTRSLAYWGFCAAVLVFAFLTGFSIGPLIFPIGVALVVLGPFRAHPRVFWPPLLAVVGFVVGYALFVPMVCTTTSGLAGDTEESVCSSILGPEYRTTGLPDPPNDLAVLAGSSICVVSGLGTLAMLTVARDRRSRGDA